MSVQSALAIIFILVLSLVLYVKRDKLKIQSVVPYLIYFVMYRTKLGLGYMDRMAKKYPRFLQKCGYAAIIIGFLGMALIAFELVRNLINLLTVPEAPAGVGLVLPIEVKGAIHVPFFYWIISIFVLAVVHEGFHGIFARLHNIKIKSSGFAFLGIIVPIIPAAFVEPDEKRLMKASRTAQLSVFAAGPFANIVLGFTLLLLFSFLIVPFLLNMYDFNGINILSVEQESGAGIAGMVPGEKIISVDDSRMSAVQNLTEVLLAHEPGDLVKVTTDNNTYVVTLGSHPDNASVSYLGIGLSQSVALKESVKERYGEKMLAVIFWFTGDIAHFGLIQWLYILNIGIGLFNLVPLGPIDGGRMLHTALLKFFPEKRAFKYWKMISLFFLAVVGINIFFSFIK